MLLQALQPLDWSPTSEALIGSTDGDKPLGLDIRIAILSLSLFFRRDEALLQLIPTCSKSLGRHWQARREALAGGQGGTGRRAGRHWQAGREALAGGQGDTGRRAGRHWQAGREALAGAHLVHVTRQRFAHVETVLIIVAVVSGRGGGA